MTDRLFVDKFAAYNIRDRFRAPLLRPTIAEFKVMQRKFLITLLTAGAIALALGLRSPYSEAAASRITTITTSADTAITAELNLTVADRITFEFKITNNSSKRVELRFPNGQTHDFVVLDSLGREVWRWSAGKMFTQALQNKLLDQHQSIAFEHSWKNPNASGTLTAVAKLASRNYPLEQRAQFVIPQRPLASR